MVNGDKDWAITCYRSRLECWEGKEFYVLPHMGYLVWNGFVLSYLNVFDFDPKTIVKRHTLNEKINRDVVGRKREIFINFRPLSVIWNRRRRIGLRGIFIESERMCDIQAMNCNTGLITGYIGTGELVDCTVLFDAKIRIIQRLFRRKSRQKSMQTLLANVRKLKAFMEEVGAVGMLGDVMGMIVELVLKSSDGGRPGQAGMAVIETELFRQSGCA